MNQLTLEQASGSVGIGTNFRNQSISGAPQENPRAKLHISGSAAAPTQALLLVGSGSKDVLYVSDSNTGRVGINTTSPGHPLHIETTSGNNSVLRLASNGDWTAELADHGSGTGEDLSWYVDSSSDRYFNIENKNGSKVAHLTVDGKVGIGVASPS